MEKQTKRSLRTEERRKDLIIAALESIRKHGFQNSTIQTISAESKLSRGLISHYFDGKTELLFEAFRHLTSQLDKRHAEVVAAAGIDPFNRLLAAAMVPFIRPGRYDEVWLHFWVWALNNPQAMEHHRDLWGRYRKAIQRMVTLAAARRKIDLDVESTTLHFVQLMDGLYVGCVLEQRYDYATCRRLMRDWLCSVYHEDPADYPAQVPAFAGTAA